MQFPAAVLACLLLLALAGCSARRVVVPDDLPNGIIRKAIWKDCRVNSKLSIVTCDCKKFDIQSQADGITILTCASKQ